jgi:transcriptional regulator with XRE-family HTH domain
MEQRGTTDMNIGQQIEIRMKAKRMSIVELENKAKLKTHAVRNILRGKSKSPSAVNLQAIADALGCSVKDLLTTPEVLEDSPPLSLEEVLHGKYRAYDMQGLLPEVVKTIDEYVQNQNKNLTVEQFLTSVKEIYLHSLQKDPKKVDRGFAEWFMSLMTE